MSCTSKTQKNNLWMLTFAYCNHQKSFVRANEKISHFMAGSPSAFTYGQRSESVLRHPTISSCFLISAVGVSHSLWNDGKILSTLRDHERWKNNNVCREQHFATTNNPIFSVINKSATRLSDRVHCIEIDVRSKNIMYAAQYSFIMRLPRLGAWNVINSAIPNNRERESWRVFSLSLRRYLRKVPPDSTRPTL